MVLWELIAAGALGGLARASYGVLKAAARKETIHLWYFFITIIVAAILGGVIGVIFNSGKGVSGLVGYVGTDIIDNIVKAAIPSKVTIKPIKNK